MMKKEPNSLNGYIFKKHTPEEISHFDRVFDVFKDLLTHTSGDIEEAFEWLEMLDKEYDIFTDEYSLADFETWEGDAAESMIAECYLEDYLFRDSCVFAAFNSFDDTKEFVDKYVAEHKLPK